ncbi:MAG: single-stranded DNA-binding protein [Anaerotignum sp.]|jgi:single-strand DNA-binding protein|nr:single-stranded DNA-binding protein [Anaerotignum sp.]
MNTVQLIGRLTRDPEVRYSQGSVPLAVARYTLAVNRAVKKGDEHPEADFISCVAFGKSGEFAEKWLKKGMRIGIEGRIQTGIFTDKDGIKRKSFDIIVSKHHFCDSKDVSGAGEAPAAQNTGMKENTDGFYEIDEDMEDDDLPF